MKGPFTDSKRRKTARATTSYEALTGARNRDLREAQIAEIRKLLLRAAELEREEACAEEAIDVAI